LLVPESLFTLKESGDSHRTLLWIVAHFAATMAATLGFMLPISTPTNAIVFSSGYIPLGRMARYGLLLDVIGFVVILFGTQVLIPGG
jgi:di/tricarboxylate transporter